MIIRRPQKYPVVARNPKADLPVAHGWIVYTCHHVTAYNWNEQQARVADWYAAAAPMRCERCR